MLARRWSPRRTLGSVVGLCGARSSARRMGPLVIARATTLVDDAGHLTILDRLKELIKVKGYQVAPAELEELLLTHPQIADAR